MARAHAILVVDDDPALREIIVSVLSEPGYLVFSASDGYEAIRILVERPIDLLLTDIVLPGLSGFELAKQARVMRPSLHVIYISGFYDQIHPNAGPSGGFMHKPFRARDLTCAVSRELEIRE